MEAQFSDDLYLRFSDLLLARCGLYYPERKRADLLHGLCAAMSAGSYESLAALYAAAAAGGPAWDELLTYLTIGETYFFRNGPQFDALRRHIIPDILQRRAATRTLRVWSAGCATGEEPYSLAMTISELLPDPAWIASILATDINAQFLARAQAALYGEWSFRETPDQLRARFWTQEQNRWRLRPEIRRMVNFTRLNLAEPCYPAIINGTCAIDLLVCRNVTIYFDDATTRQVVDRFFGALAPGGWLIVGHSEPQANIYRQFEVHNFPDTVVYRKPLDAPLFSLDMPKRARSPERNPKPEPHEQRHGTPVVRRAATDQQQGPPQTRQTQPLEPMPTSARDAATLLNDARQSADRGAWDAAEHYCAQVLEQDPLCVGAYYLLGQIHEHQGALDAALADYRRTVYLDRGFVPGLLGMAHVWRQMGRMAEARRYYENTLQHIAQLAPTALVPGAGGATARELAALVEQQLRSIKRV